MKAIASLMKKFIFIDHTADIKFQAFGRSVEDAFSNSAMAMYSVIMDPKKQEKLPGKIEKKIEVESNDYEGLLYDFLEEFLYLLDAEFFLLKKIKKIKISAVNNRFFLRAVVFGDTNENYETEKHIKAATYNEMYIKQNSKTSWEIQAVLDI
jgi:SHS2 domain-containing protein